MRDPSKWNYDQWGNLQEWSVWAQSSLNSRTKRWAARADKRAEYHEQQLLATSQEVWGEEYEVQEQGGEELPLIAPKPKYGPKLGSALQKP